MRLINFHSNHNLFPTSKLLGDIVKMLRKVDSLISLKVLMKLLRE